MKVQKFVVLFFVTLLLDLTVVHPVPVFASQTNTQNTHQSVAAALFDLSPTSLVTLLTAVEKLPQDMLARSDQAEIARFMLEYGVNLQFTGERAKKRTWVVHYFYFVDHWNRSCRCLKIS